MIFEDRSDAGQRLAQALPKLDREKTVVVALPRGGVPVAAEICAARELPMDLVFVRKIGAPHQQELAVGAITDGSHPHVTINHDVARHLGLTDADVRRMGDALLPEIERRRARYLQGRNQVDLSGKTLVVVDDGVATGSTLLASLKALKGKAPAKMFVALPVAPRGFEEDVKGLADETICLSDLTYGSVGAAYRRFDQVDDETVVRLMQRHSAEQPPAT